MARMARRSAKWIVCIFAVLLPGCSQAAKDYVAVRYGLVSPEQMTPRQRKLELERLAVSCIGYVHDGRAKAAGESRGTMEECMEKVGYNRLLEFDRDQGAKAAPQRTTRGG